MRHKIYSGILLIVFLTGCTQAQNEDSRLQWHRWDDGIIAAHNEEKFLLVDVYTDWCGWCKKMDKTTYADPQVQELLSGSFSLVKLNAESDEKITSGTEQYTEREWSKMLKVSGYPTILVFDSQLKLVAHNNGYLDAANFQLFLKFITGKYYTQYTFGEFLVRARQGN